MSLTPTRRASRKSAFARSARLRSAPRRSASRRSTSARFASRNRVAPKSNPRRSRPRSETRDRSGRNVRPRPDRQAAHSATPRSIAPRASRAASGSLSPRPILHVVVFGHRVHLADSKPSSAAKMPARISLVDPVEARPAGSRATCATVQRERSPQIGWRRARPRRRREREPNSSRAVAAHGSTGDESRAATASLLAEFGVAL